MKSKAERSAVIDLGTNTFHLLIVEYDDEGKWNEIFRERNYVYLASAGIGKISPDAFEKGIKTLKYFKQIIDSFNVRHYKAIGTAALRTASNRNEFIDQVKNETKIKIEVINGDQEATYISDGVELALGNELNDYLIMDIGGGSVEFIINLNNEVKWQKSFPVGLAILKEQAFFSDPLDKNAIRQYDSFILKQIHSLFKVPILKEAMPLVGASGTFDALLRLLPFKDVGRICKMIDVKDLQSVYNEIIPLTYSERAQHPGIPNERVELFSLALQLVKTIVERLNTSSIYISPYALKEGVLQSLK